MGSGAGTGSQRGTWNLNSGHFYHKKRKCIKLLDDNFLMFSSRSIAHLIYIWSTYFTSAMMSHEHIKTLLVLKLSDDRFLHLLNLSVSTHIVIGQFSGPYFTVRPAEIESCSLASRPINLRDIINIVLTSFSRPVL